MDKIRKILLIFALLNIQLDKVSKIYWSISKTDDCPQTDLPEFAFIGRSNVGKSFDKLNYRYLVI